MDKSALNLTYLMTVVRSWISIVTEVGLNKTCPIIRLKLQNMSQLKTQVTFYSNSPNLTYPATRSKLGTTYHNDRSKFRVSNNSKAKRAYSQQLSNKLAVLQSHPEEKSKREEHILQ